MPFFALLGPSDFSARLPSVVFLLGTCLVFYALGRRLAPRSPGLSGLLAVAFLLASPNVLTFSAQSLTESAALFFCFLALLAYVRSLERGHPRGRALAAGAALAVAMLTKYDHGGLLALCLGLYELGRHRFRAAALPGRRRDAPVPPAPGRDRGLVRAPRQARLPRGQRVAPLRRQRAGWYSWTSSPPG